MIIQSNFEVSDQNNLINLSISKNKIIGLNIPNNINFDDFKNAIAEIIVEVEDYSNSQRSNIKQSLKTSSFLTKGEQNVIEQIDSTEILTALNKLNQMLNTTNINSRLLNSNLVNKNKEPIIFNQIDNLPPINTELTEQKNFFIEEGVTKEVISNYEIRDDLKEITINGKIYLYNPKSIDTEANITPANPLYSSSLMSERDMQFLSSRI